MPQCAPKRRKDLDVCAGDIDKSILVFVRHLKAPSDDSVDVIEEFVEQRNMRAMVETLNGETIFDKTNTERIVTHRFTVRWQPSIITFENYLVYAGKNYQILSVENQNERNKFFVIKATDRGDRTLPVNQT